MSTILSAPSPLSIPSRIFISSLILSREIKTGSVLKNFLPRYSNTSLICGTTDETTMSVTSEILIFLVSARFFSIMNKVSSVNFKSVGIRKDAVISPLSS